MGNQSEEFGMNESTMMSWCGKSVCESRIVVHVGCGGRSRGLGVGYRFGGVKVG